MSRTMTRDAIEHDKTTNHPGNMARPLSRMDADRLSQLIREAPKCVDCPGPRDRRCCCGARIFA